MLHNIRCSVSVLFIAGTLCTLNSCHNSGGTDSNSSDSTHNYVQFKILDRFTGLPIPGVRVQLFATSGYETTSDTDGIAHYTDGTIGGDITFGFTKVPYVTLRHHVYCDTKKTLYDTVYMLNPSDYLVAFYPFSQSAIDSSGRGNNGVLTGGQFMTDRFGASNCALSLNGLGDIVTVPNSPSLNFGRSSDFTVCVWAFQQPSGGTPNGCLLSHTISSPFGGYELGYIDGKIHMHVAALPSDWDHLWVAGEYDARWHYYVLTVERSGTLRLYIDGKLSLNYPIDKTAFQGSLDQAAPLLLGGNGVPSRAFRGGIDDVRIYSIALDEETVASLFLN